jgi:hypothetical protein
MVSVLIFLLHEPFLANRCFFQILAIINTVASSILCISPYMLLEEFF